MIVLRSLTKNEYSRLKMFLSIKATVKRAKRKSTPLLILIFIKHMTLNPSRYHLSFKSKFFGRLRGPLLGEGGGREF